MKGIAQWMNFRMKIGLLSGVLAGLLFCGVSGAANVITANLQITPSPIVKPGDTLKFQATIFHQPTFPMQPESLVRCWVTRNNFSWVSEKLDIQYPGMGTVTVNFTKGFTIPADAKSGQVFDFYLVYGIWYPMSNKATVKVQVLTIRKAPVMKKRTKVDKKPVTRKPEKMRRTN